MSSSGWSRHFKCQISLSINSRIPLLPFSFPKFSLLTFVIHSSSKSILASLVFFRLEPGIVLILVLKFSFKFQDV